MVENVQDNDNSFDESLEGFKTHLLENQLNEASELVLNSDISDTEVESICNEVIKLVIAKNQYAQAVRVAEFGKIHSPEIEKIYHLEYKKLIKNKKYLEAAQWGKEFGFEEMEIARAAHVAFAGMLKNDKFDDAIKVFDTYNLNKEDLLGVTIETFNRAYEIKNYLGAAILGEKFAFSKTKTLGAAYKAYMKSLNALKFSEALVIAEKFELFRENSIEVLDEQSSAVLYNSTFEKYLEPFIDEGNIKAVENFYVRLDIQNINDSSIKLKEFQTKFYAKIIEKHNELLNTGKIGKAIELREKLSLPTSPIPKHLLSSMIETAEVYHNNLLEKSDLRNAHELKESYNLFTKATSVESLFNLHKSISVLLLKTILNGKMDVVKEIFTEYDLPKEYTNKALLASVMSLLDKDNVEEAFNVQKEYNVKIYDEESKQRVISRFEEGLEKRDYQTAILVAEKFKLGDKLIEEASLKYWQYKFKMKKYDEALKVLQEFKVPRKKTKELARSHYQIQKKNNNIELASNIRKTYRLQIGLIDLVREFLMLFSKKPST